MFLTLVLTLRLGASALFSLLLLLSLTGYGLLPLFSTQALLSLIPSEGIRQIRFLSLTGRTLVLPNIFVSHKLLCLLRYLSLLSFALCTLHTRLLLLPCLILYSLYISLSEDRQRMFPVLFCMLQSLSCYIYF